MHYLSLDRDSSSCHELVSPQKGKQKYEIYNVATSFLMYRIDTQGAYFKVATPLVVSPTISSVTVRIASTVIL